MIFKRSEYLNKLIGRKHNGLIKLVTGTRRVGKRQYEVTSNTDLQIS